MAKLANIMIAKGCSTTVIRESRKPLDLREDNEVDLLFEDGNMIMRISLWEGIFSA